MMEGTPKLLHTRGGVGRTIQVASGVPPILASIDFETYSPAGFFWNDEEKKFKGPPGTKNKGLPAVGVANYTLHPQAEVMCLGYHLPNNPEISMWVPGQKIPHDLFEFIRSGGVVEAWNMIFDFMVWNNLCTFKYGFPTLPDTQISCARAKSQAHSLPASLDASGKALNIIGKKDKDGMRLIRKFSMPNKPTKIFKNFRILASDDPADAQNFYDYCAKDILAQEEILRSIPDLSEFEKKVWLLHHRMNVRGVHVDVDLIHGCVKILDEANTVYNKELQALTFGKVTSSSQLPALKKWLISKGLTVTSLDKEHIEDILKKDLPYNMRRALEIRQLMNSAAVKKVFAINNQMTREGQLHDLFVYHGAHTGRATGSGPQPQNLPNSGPEVWKCSCDRYTHGLHKSCVWCGAYPAHRTEWNADSAEDAISILKTGNFPLTEYYYKKAPEVISACLRGAFISAPGHDFIFSDYSAIEAVTLAALAKEEWRLEVFRTHGKIYEMSASTITGIPFETFINHYEVNGTHHPMRKKVGKVAELASGFGGGLGSWKAFGADDFFTDPQIKESIKKWREASPNIVKFWYGVEECAINAIGNPGESFSHNDITFTVHENVMYCRVLSGGFLTYHEPLLTPSSKGWSKPEISYKGWNSNHLQGPVGWVRKGTYGGRLTENIASKSARDIFMHAMINLDQNKYPVVLQTHDEFVGEVPEGFGSVQDFERIMNIMPDWAQGWPIKAHGGRRDKRYAK